MSLLVEETGGRTRVRRAVVFAVVLLVATFVAAIWLAVSVSVDTAIEIDEDTGLVHVTGTEAKFVGSVAGTYMGRPVLIDGLVVAGDLTENPLAWRAVCAVRNDEGTDWSRASENLRANLHSPQIEEQCRPFT